MDKDIIRSYYESEEFLSRAELPTEPGWRHYRGKRATGGWKKIPLRITSIKKLQKWVLRLNLSDIYYTTSSWLNPHKLAEKHFSGSYVVADNCLLAQDLVFDIDAPEPISIEGLEKARKLTSKIYGLVIDLVPLVELRIISFTGAKGFRLVFDDKTDWNPGNPIKRIDYFVEKRKILIAKMLKYLNPIEKSMLDVEVTTNPLCVIRLIGSANSKTGFLSIKLTKEELCSDIKEILNHVPALCEKERLGNALSVMTKEDPILKKDGSVSSARHKQEDDVSSLTSPPRFFISNRVMGLNKCYVPLLTYPIDKNFLGEIKRLQKTEKLGNLYIFYTKTQAYVLGLKVMQRRAFEKFLNKTTSNNRRSFKRRHRVLMPVNASFYKVIPGRIIQGLSNGHAMIVNAKGDSGDNKIEIIKAKNKSNIIPPTKVRGEK